MNYTHEFHEFGNGFPTNGDHVICDEGNGWIKILLVKETSGIFTRQFQANYMYLVCSEAESDIDWDELEEHQQDDIYQNYHHVSKVIRNYYEYDL